MMIKGGIRIGGLGISGYDADAAAYFDRAGVTDTTAKTQINAFVKGVKDLGLWSSIVSWPLLSSQNKGSGTIAYSLGGYGIYNGTLSSSGLWSTDGLSISIESNFLNTGLNLGASPESLFMVSNIISDPGANGLFLITAGVNQNGRQLYLTTSAVATLDAYAGFRDTWATFSFGYDFPNTGLPTRVGARYISFRPQTDASMNLTCNNSNYTSAATGWGTSSAGQIVPRGGNVTTKLGFFAYTNNTVITNALDASLRSLYKTTMGTGLGLP
jgi:hypothetical protein